MRVVCHGCGRAHRFRPDIGPKEVEARLGAIGWALIYHSKDKGHGVCCEVCVANYEISYLPG